MFGVVVPAIRDNVGKALFAAGANTFLSRFFSGGITGTGDQLLGLKDCAFVSLGVDGSSPQVYLGLVLWYERFVALGAPLPHDKVCGSGAPVVVGEACARSMWMQKI